MEFPGEIDLSAYVNFLHLSDACRKVPNIKTSGPIPQGLFLESMGMATRLDVQLINLYKRYYVKNQVKDK